MHFTDPEKTPGKSNLRFLHRALSGEKTPIATWEWKQFLAVHGSNRNNAWNLLLPTRSQATCHPGHPGLECPWCCCPKGFSCGPVNDSTASTVFTLVLRLCVPGLYVEAWLLGDHLEIEDQHENGDGMPANSNPSISPPPPRCQQLSLPGHLQQKSTCHTANEAAGRRLRSS